MDHTLEIEKLKNREAAILSRIQKLNGYPDSYLDAVSKSFPLGMVGGSGRNTHSLNKRRERSLEKTISNAVETTNLNRDLEAVQWKISDLEAGGPEKRALLRQKVKETEKAREKAERANMTAKDRLFIGDYPGGFVYADKKVMKNGDYKRLAFLPRNSKQLEMEVNKIDPAIKELIEQHSLTAFNS